MKKPLKVPKFKNEDEEREFWDKISFADYYEPGDLKRVRFPNLKPSATPISIRLPNYMISELKVRANRLDIPYQALIKQAIAKELATDSYLGNAVAEARKDYAARKKLTKKNK